MKKLNFEQMENISAGGQNRTCMLLGAATVVVALIPGWGLGAAYGTAVTAAVYGCF